LTTLAELLATLSSGLFAGASIYINMVEHPARMEAGTNLALTEFAPSYHRATVTQVSLASAGFLSALVAWRVGSDTRWLIGGGLLVSVIPFTAVAILPTNKKLLDPATANDLRSRPATRWRCFTGCSECPRAATTLGGTDNLRRGVDRMPSSTEKIHEIHQRSRETYG
jgi:hypothetical protein